jgi:hypothetical protein
MIIPAPQNRAIRLAGQSPASGTFAMNARYEKKRRVIVSFVLLIFLLWIFEGVLRKWIFPAESRILYFIRDPFVIVLYVYALVTGLWPRKFGVLNIGLVLAVGVLAISGIQLFVGYGIESNTSPLIFALYGWRNYFLYIPLAFLIGEHFEKEDFNKIRNLTIFIGMLSSALVFLQFHAPITSAINVGSSDDVTQQFIGLGLDETHTRPMGTFTSVVGQSGFVALLSALTFISLAGMGTARNRYREIAVGVLGAVATLICVAYSGSRGEVMSLLVAMLTAMTLLTARGAVQQRNKIIKISFGVVVVGIILGLTWFRAGVEALIQRWTSAYSTESVVFTGGIFGRALYGFIDFGRLLFETPLIGLGLGTAGNASTLLGATYHNAVPLAIAETDWSRHIFELGPVVGVLLIAFRIAVFIWLLRKVAATPTIATTLLFGTVGLTELYGSIATHGSANVCGWLTIGFCLAALRNKNIGPNANNSFAGQRKFANVLGTKK